MRLWGIVLLLSGNALLGLDATLRVAFIELRREAMMASRRGGIIFILLLMASLWGCSSAVTLAPSPLTSPFFPPTAEDAKRVEVLTHELDNQAVHCLEASNCAEVHFARALVSLFENQQAASLSFRHAIEDAPSGALSDSSRLWLQLMNDEAVDVSRAKGSQQIILRLMAYTVREWMTRELAEHRKQTGDSLGVVRALQKQVRERDRRIAVLQSQMEDLKTIDQDQEKRKRAIRLPDALR